MPYDREPLLKRLKREGSWHFALELLSSVISPWLAHIGVCIVLVVSGVVMWLSSLDPLILWVGLLLAVGSSLWIVNQFRLYRRKPIFPELPKLVSNDTALVSGESTKSEPPVALLASYTSKRSFTRTDTESGPRGNFHIIKCRLWNASQKTISNITVNLFCRTWTGGMFLFQDAGPVHVRFDRTLTLNPHEEVEFVLLSQNEDDADSLYLGDHKDDNAGRIKIVHEREATHFITVNVGAQDMIPTVKNFVAITLKPSRLVALEYDSRRWKSHDGTPAPFGTYKAPYQ